MTAGSVTSTPMEITTAHEKQHKSKSQRNGSRCWFARRRRRLGFWLVVGSLLLLIAATQKMGGSSNLDDSSSKDTQVIADRDENPDIAVTKSSAINAAHLRLVSFNVAGCAPSAEAPSNWNSKVAREEMKWQVLADDPEILALQEYPTGDTTQIQQSFPQYQVMGSKRSHANHVVLLIKNGILARPISQDEMMEDIPAVLAELTLTLSSKSNKPQEYRLLVASVHLAPFREGSIERQMQVEALLNLAKEKEIQLLFAGDTNMRETEDDVMEEAPFGLLDAWKLAGSEQESKYTWDTIDHTTTAGSGCFNRYYGQSTRQYTARYDRVYLSDNTSNKTTISVGSFKLIANEPLTNPYHFLSDHFGLSTELTVQWNG